MSNTTNSDTPTLLLTPQQAAEALAISARKLWAMTNTGDIPCVRLGRSVRYDPADLRAFIDRQKTGSGPAEVHLRGNGRE